MRGRRSPVFRADERGATLVEFALIAPMFMAVLLGIFGLSLYLFQTHSLNRAMREAVREVLVEELKDQSSIEGHIEQKLDDTGFSTARCSVSVDVISDEESVAHVRVTYDFAPGLPFGAGTLFEHVFATEIPIFTGFL